MAFYRVSADRLQYVSVFGYKILHEDDNLMLLENHSGSILVDKNNPTLWFDEIEDAMQFGAAAIIPGL